MGREIWVAEVSDLKYPRILNTNTPRLLLGSIVAEYKDKTPSQYVDLINNGLHTNSEVTNNDYSIIFGYNVKDPNRYGVIDFDANMKVLSLEEKPKNPKSN